MTDTQTDIMRTNTLYNHVTGSGRSGNTNTPANATESNHAPRRALVRWTGSKWRCAPWLISKFPKHRVYVEPYGGSAAVLLRKTRSEVEVYNDLNSDLLNIFSVFRDRALAEELARACRLTLYSQDEYYAAYEPATDPVERARRSLVRAFMGFGANGLTRESPTGFAFLYGGRDRRAEWNVYPDYFPELHARLREVVISNKPAVELMRQYDGPDTLFYVDPPYMAGTWLEAGREYQTGAAADGLTLTEADHAELLDTLRGLTGFVVLSGYDNDLYARVLADWEKDTMKNYTANANAGSRTECVWLNPRAAAEQAQRRLF